MDNLNIAIIIGTIRAQRFADLPAQWMLDQAQRHGGASYEIVDLRDYPLPLFAAAKSPMVEPSSDPVAQRWCSKIQEFDGYIYMTAEYNHCISGALKNALDYLHHELYRKPAAFVGYGEVGGAMAIGQLRLISVELQMAPLRNVVHIGGSMFDALSARERNFGDYPELDKAAEALLKDMLWWSGTLKSGRAAQA